MKKKVLFLIHDLSVGGAEKVLVNLVNNLDREKYDITVMTLFAGGVNEQFLHKDIIYKSIFRKTFRGNSKFFLLFSPEKLHKLFIKDHYDIEISYLEGPSARIISGCRDKSTKIFTWIHVEQHTRAIAAKAFRNFKEAEKCYSKFNKIIAVSDYVMNDFLKLFPQTRDIQVLYNTNETGIIQEKKDEIVEERIFLESEFKIVGVGKIMPIKGFDKLARIHKKLISHGYPVHTYVLGVGDDQKKIEDYLRTNGIENSFTFLGYQTNPYKYVAKCDLFVCASIAEGFSTAATEALIVGIPVVTTDVSGMKEMLGESNEYGIVTENNEEALYLGIKTLLDDQDAYQYYKMKAEERGRFFSKEKTVQAVENMLDQF